MRYGTAKITDIAGDTIGYHSGEQYPYYGYHDNKELHLHRLHHAGYHDWYTTSVIRFKTPNIPVKITQLNLGLKSIRSVRTGKIRYAICTSDENYELYMNVYGAVADENQLTGGTFEVTFAGGTSASDPTTDYSIEIPCDKLRHNTTYYLFLWSGDKDYNSGHISFSEELPESSYIDMEIVYLNGAIRISKDNELKVHLCYIDNGENWTLFAPYIDTGESWSTCI